MFELLGGTAPPKAGPPVRLRMQLRPVVRVAIECRAPDAGAPFRQLAMRSRLVPKLASQNVFAFAGGPPARMGAQPSILELDPLATLPMLRVGGDKTEVETPRFELFVPPIPGVLELQVRSPTIMGDARLEIPDGETSVNGTLDLKWH